MARADAGAGAGAGRPGRGGAPTRGGWVPGPPRGWVQDLPPRYTNHHSTPFSEALGDFDTYTVVNSHFSSAAEGHVVTLLPYRSSNHHLAFRSTLSGELCTCSGRARGVGSPDDDGDARSLAHKEGAQRGEHRRGGQVGPHPERRDHDHHQPPPWVVRPDRAPATPPKPVRGSTARRSTRRVRRALHAMVPRRLGPRARFSVARAAALGLPAWPSTSRHGPPRIAPSLTCK
jgi:hypothetical protein